MMNTIAEGFLVTPNLLVEICQDYAKWTKEAKSSKFQLSRNNHITCMDIDLIDIHQSYRMDSTTDVYNENALHI